MTFVRQTATMELLANHFGFTEDALGQLLYLTNSFIAGGAPLAVFQEKGMFPDMDLDIFLRIPVEWSNSPFKRDTGKGLYYNYDALAKKEIHGALQLREYHVVKENNPPHRSKWGKMVYDETTDIEYWDSALSHFIKNITTYQRKDGRKIQIITLYDCSIETFMETFDLNICRLAIVGVQQANWGMKLMTSHLSALELNEIRSKHMYIYNPLYRANLARRIHKYIRRGFLWVMPKTYESLEEYGDSLGDIRDYISVASIPEITTFEQFMEAKRSRLSIATPAVPETGCEE